MIVDRLRAYAQAVGNLGIAAAFCNQMQNLPLARRQLIALRTGFQRR